MTVGVIDDYLSIEECIHFFEKEGFSFKCSELTDEGLRRVYTFNYRNKENLFYFSVREKEIFLGIQDKTERARIKMSKVVHRIIQELSQRPCTAMLQLLLEEDWYKLGAAVISSPDKYDYLINPKNYRSIKKEIKQAFGKISFAEQEDGYKLIYFYGKESGNVIRALKALGYAESKKTLEGKQVQLTIRSEYKNKDLFVSALNQFGCTAV